MSSWQEVVLQLGIGAHEGYMFTFPLKLRDREATIFDGH